MLSINEHLSTLEKKIDGLSNLIDQQTQRPPHYLNYNGGHFFQPHNIIPSYYHLGWRTYQDFSYGRPNFQSQGGSSYNYQEQIWQPFNEEQFYALLNEMKKNNATCEAKMKDNFSNEEAPMTNLKNSIRKLAHALEEQYSRQLPSDIKDEDKRECNFVPLSFEEKIQDLTLVEEKKNELANDEELLVEERQVEEQHPRKTIENVLVGIDKFNFPIDFVTVGMEEDQQASYIGIPSHATSQA